MWIRIRFTGMHIATSLYTCHAHWRSKQGTFLSFGTQHPSARADWCLWVLASLAAKTWNCMFPHTKLKTNLWKLLGHLRKCHDFPAKTQHREEHFSRGLSIQTSHDQRCAVRIELFETHFRQIHRFLPAHHMGKPYSCREPRCCRRRTLSEPLGLQTNVPSWMFVSGNNWKIVTQYFRILLKFVMHKPKKRSKII